MITGYQSKSILSNTNYPNLVSILKFIPFTILILCTPACRIVIVNNDNAWEEQGPGPLLNGQAEGLTDNPVIGAISCISPDPDDPDRIIIGAVNGGIWKTENANSDHPDWIPVNDTLPSLSITCIQRDRLNPDILYAGTGDVSSTDIAGPSKGIYKSTDRGDTWTTITTDLNGRTIHQIAVGLYNPTADSNGVIYAATLKSLFRSFDGHTFDTVPGVPDTLISDVYCDLKGTMVIVAIPGDSVLISFDSGNTFRGLRLDCSSSINIKLSVLGNRLFVAQSHRGSTEAFIDVVDLSDTSHILPFAGPTTLEDLGFTHLGPFTFPQSQLHFSLVTFPYSDHEIEIFLGGVANNRLFLGATGQGNYSGRIFHGTFNTNFNTLTWGPVVGNGANGTAPHADSRCLVFDKDENLLESDDGGIYQLTSPFLLSADRKWRSLNGDLRISEVMSVSFDERNDAIIAGLQDNGSVEQITSAFSDDEKTWTTAKLFSILGVNFSHQVGDGFSVNVDNQHDPPIRYTILNNMQDVYKREYHEIDPGTVGAPWTHFSFNNGCVLDYCALDPKDKNDIDTDFPIFVRFELNRLDQKKFVMGALAIYKFDNRGDDLHIIDTVNRRLTLSVAYGAEDMPEVVYHIRNRDTMINQQPETDAAWNRKPFRSFMQDLAIDVDHGENIFVITSDSVFSIRDFSDSMLVDDFTFNLPSILLEPASLSVISTFKVDVEDVGEKQEILIGAQGAVYILAPFRSTFRWVRLGKGLPNTPVSEIRYFREDDILVVGTVGRGVWVMKNFSQKVPRLRLKVV